MATRVWTNGGGDGLFTTAGNWSGAAVPTTGDNIIVPKTTSAITCTGMAAAAFGTLEISPECYLPFGTSGTPLSGSFTEIRHFGRSGAKLYFTDTAVGATARILIAGEPGADLADLTGALPFVVVERGRAKILSSATAILRASVGKVGSRASDAYLHIESTDTTTDLHVHGGLCVCESILVRAHVSGGILVRRGSAAVSTSLTTTRDGRVYYEGTGAVAALYCEDDSYTNFDYKFQDSPSAAPDARTAAVTITASFVHPGAKLYANSLHITKTAATVDWSLFSL